MNCRILMATAALAAMALASAVAAEPGVRPAASLQLAAEDAAKFGYRIEVKSAAKATRLEFEIRNPLVDSGALADPELHRFRDKSGKDVWWVYGTHNAKENIGAAYSTDGMKTWTLVPGVLDTSTFPWAAKNRKMWAPSAMYKDGKYYLSFSSGDSHGTCDDKGISIGVADSPGGPFKSVRRDGPVVRDFVNKAVVIDQDLFMDEDAQVYMYFGGGGHCNVCKLNKDLTATVPFNAPNDGSNPNGTKTRREICDDSYGHAPWMACLLHLALCTDFDRTLTNAQGAPT